MVDSALNNVGTYGVRYDLNLHLLGRGPHDLVLSHPVASGRSPFTAFRGSIRIEADEGLRDVHIGLRSGQSLSISALNLKQAQINRIKVSLVYPADATPGHLLSVVPVHQLAMLRRQQAMQASAERALSASKHRQVIPTTPPPLIPAATQPPTLQSRTASPGRGTHAMPPAMLLPQRVNATLEQTYRDAIRAQQEWLRRLQGR